MGECVRWGGFESSGMLARLCVDVRKNVRFASQVSENGTCCWFVFWVLLVSESVVTRLGV